MLLTMSSIDHTLKNKSSTKPQNSSLKEFLRGLMLRYLLTEQLELGKPTLCWERKPNEESCNSQSNLYTASLSLKVMMLK